MKLIDADMLCNYCDNNINHSITPNEIMRMPFIDAEPVVKCKNCKWWTKQKGSAQGRCERLEIYPTGEWFCANGKKRGNDDDSD